MGMPPPRPPAVPGAYGAPSSPPAWGPPPPPNFALDVGRVLEQTFSAWKANLVPFTILAYILQGPIHVLQFLIADVVQRQGAAQGSGILLYLGLLGLANLILAAAIPYGVFEHLRGRTHDLPSILGNGLSRVLPVLGTALLVTIATTLAMCALCFPAFIVTAMLFVAVPVAVIEDVNPFAALSRSKDLTENNLLRLLGLYFIVVVPVGILSLVVKAVLMVALKGPAGELLANLLLVPLGCFLGIVQAVSYSELRTGREGSSVEDLVKVFE